MLFGRLMNDAPEHPPLRTYGRVQSRKLKPRAAGLMSELLPRLSLPEGPVQLSGETWIEIGFGGGEHLAGQAARRPDVAFIGAEPFVNGMASALRHMADNQLANVRLLHGDGRDLLSRLPDQSVTRVFLLFPDPWPKARHNKRRFVQGETIGEIHRVLRPDGTWRVATDVAAYADWTIEQVRESGLFDWPGEGGDPHQAPDDHIPTRYQLKGLGDCAPVFFDFVRR